MNLLIVVVDSYLIVKFAFAKNLVKFAFANLASRRKQAKINS